MNRCTNGKEKRERKTDTLSRINEILRPVEDREKRNRDRIFNGPSETPEEHRPIPFAPCSPASSRPHRIRPIGARFRSYRETDTEVAGGVRLVTAFRETPRDSLHPLGGFFGEVQPQRELSSASSSSSDGSSVTSQYSYTPEEFRAIPFVKTPSSPPPFTPCPPSPSRPHRSQIPVRTKNYRETGYLVSIDEKLGEELQPVWNPSDTLELSLSLLSQDDWQKKIQGLRYIRTLARHHQDKLTSLNLRKVCLGVTQEIKNNRSCVSCAALDTVGYLCVHLKERMDTEADLTCESLLRVFAGANANPFIQQHAKEALTALVHHCSPSRFITSLERHGLKHKSVLVRAGAALGLLMISEVMGAEKVLSAGQSFTTRFLSAVSVVCLDASSEVRAHGKAILKDLVKQRNFKKMWVESVSDKSRHELQKRLRDVFPK